MKIFPFDKNQKIVMKFCDLDPDPILFQCGSRIRIKIE